MNQERTDLTRFAVEAYRAMPHARDYALSEDGKNTLGVLACALFQKRAAENRTSDTDPSARDEFAVLIKKLHDAGCNVLQQRPGDPLPTPKPWVDPVTGAQLPNPFAKDSEDLKAQTILTKRDPELAAHYKAMADHAYGRLAAIMDEEAKRQSLGAIRYTGDEHKLNPFLGTNKTAQGAFMQRDVELARFFAEEAKPVSLPLFGANRNLTIEGRLLRDPAAASLLKIGNVILRQWIETDKAAALEQRAAAEKEIERLQAQAGIA